MNLPDLLAHFITVQHQNAASLFSDVNGEELIPQPCLKMALLKAMGFGRRLFAALFFTA
jgi:hypothetical protein